MDWDLIVNGLVGLGGASIGGYYSMKATKTEIVNQEKQQKNEMQERRKITANAISTFLIKEINYNVNNLSFINEYMDVGYDVNKLNSVLLKRKLQFDEFEKLKYRLLETDTIISLKTIEIYHMFYMVSDHGSTKKKLGEFSENQFNYFKNRYELAKKMVDEYYDKKYENF